MLRKVWNGVHGTILTLQNHPEDGLGGATESRLHDGVGPVTSAVGVCADQNRIGCTRLTFG